MMMKSKLLGPNARLVEVVLYVENEPVSIERISELTRLGEREVKAALKELKEFSLDTNRGLVLDEDEEGFSFTPASDLYDQLRKAYGRKVDKRLSKACMETLAIIAYEQPVTRKRVTNIRGVNSDNVIRILRDRDYIKITGRSDEKGHPCLYSTSRKFLIEFNLKSSSDLPRLQEVERRFSKDEELGKDKDKSEEKEDE